MSSTTLAFEINPDQVYEIADVQIFDVAFDESAIVELASDTSLIAGL
ncbi:MAG: hypothetical protein AAFZ06_09165 [Pseudomonadota bacterium]